VAFVGLVDGEALGRTAVDGGSPEVALVGEGDAIPVRMHGGVAHERIGVLSKGRGGQKRAQGEEGEQAGSHEGGEARGDRHNEGQYNEGQYNEGQSDSKLLPKGQS